MMKRRIRYLCVLLCACLLFTGCAAAGTAVYDGRTVTFEEPTWPETEDEIFVSMAELTMEQVVSGASHIVDAEFLGFYASEKLGETHLLFQVNQIYKGSFEEKKLVITGRNTGATCEDFGNYVMETLQNL